MPGPVSDSMPEMFDLPFKQRWLQELNDNGIRYFVLKIEDFFRSLDDLEVAEFNNMLRKCERFRKSKGKKASNDYWIVNRDEPFASKVKKLIEEHYNIVLKERSL